jgi:hypothetical protein
MQPASNDADAPRKDDAGVAHKESASGSGRATGDGDLASNPRPRPEPRVDTDDRTPEEAGYGHGV